MSSPPYCCFLPAFLIALQGSLFHNGFDARGTLGCDTPKSRLTHPALLLSPLPFAPCLMCKAWRPLLALPLASPAPLSTTTHPAAIESLRRRPTCPPETSESAFSGTSTAKRTPRATPRSGPLMPSAPATASSEWSRLPRYLRAFLPRLPQNTRRVVESYAMLFSVYASYPQCSVCFGYAVVGEGGTLRVGREQTFFCGIVHHADML